MPRAQGTDEMSVCRIGGVTFGLVALAVARLATPAAGLETCSPGQGEPVRTAAIEDYRTLRLEDGRKLVLAGIDSFSILTGRRTEFDSGLRRKLDELVGAKDIQFVPAAKKPDRYGRTMAFVFAERGLIQSLLTASGRAVHVPQPGVGGPCMAAIGRSESQARRTNAGFWRTGAVAVRPANPAVLSRHIGRYAIVEGKVVSVGTRRNRTYLNFGHRWVQDFTVEIARSDRELFGGAEALEELAGHVVRVRGYLDSRGGPMIRIAMPGQLEAADNR